MQPVDRRDVDTTGLLADRRRRAAAPAHVAKVYEVTTKHAATPALAQRLADGVRFALAEGKSHQVKHMVAAAGNRVEALHRSVFAGLTLGDPVSGQWRWIDPEESILPSTSR